MELVNEQVKGAQPLLTPDDCSDAEEVAKADARVQQLLKERGITNLDLVAADPWSVVRISISYTCTGSDPLRRIGDLWLHAVSVPSPAGLQLTTARDIKIDDPRRYAAKPHVSTWLVHTIVNTQPLPQHRLNALS